MPDKLQAAPGTFDVLPADAAARAAIELRAGELLGAAGYERIHTPIFEPTEVFSRGVGASTDIVSKEMYTFDDGGGRSLTLRPEGTAPVCRAFVEHGMHKLALPVKLWYLGPFFRAERPQKGRFRQFFQVGAEAIGSDDPAVDAESILLLATLLADLGVRGVQIRLASLGQPAGRVEYREQLQAYLLAHEDQLSQEVRDRIDLNPLRAFDADHPGTRAVMANAPVLLDFLDADDAAHFAEVRAMLDAVDLAYAIDPTLVRGLDYYTRTLFEVTSDALGAQSAVGGGGRYDGLVEQLGGPATPGMGWAAGIERIVLAGGAPPTAPPLVDLLLAGPADPGTFLVAHEARRAGLHAQVDLGGRSRKGVLKQADRIGARYVAWVHEDGSTQLRDLESGTQNEVTREELVRTVLRGPAL